jgi:hypothetical protein
MNDHTLQRLESKIDKSGDCWLWTGAILPSGYGLINIKQQQYYVHRLIYMLYNGTIPDGMSIRHKCRGKCVNPEHLEIGTRSENMKDKIRDGTDNRGERNLAAKLTAEKVLEIRSRSNELESDLAKEFGVSIKTINQIIRRETWKHI